MGNLTLGQCPIINFEIMNDKNLTTVITPVGAKIREVIWISVSIQDR